MKFGVYNTEVNRQILFTPSTSDFLVHGSFEIVEIKNSNTNETRLAYMTEGRGGSFYDAETGEHLDPGDGWIWEAWY